MTNYSSSTFPFAGLMLDGFIIDGEAYLTLTSLASGLHISRQTVKDWVNRHCKVEGEPVRVGEKNKAATAYPLEVITDFVKYRLSLGHRLVEALVLSSFQADLERSIRESNGQQVTASQHETTRATIRQHLIDEVLEAKQQLAIARELIYGNSELPAGITYIDARRELEKVEERYSEVKFRSDWTQEEANQLQKVGITF